MQNQESVELVVIPNEIQESIKGISTEKKGEIEETLSQIFAGTANWKAQVNSIEVAGIEDKMSIQLAEVARKNAKDARLSAEKLLDAKRDAVQKLKLEFDTEDKMWLKVKQIVQITFKEIESMAEYKANTVKRHDAEQKELKVQLRINQVQKFSNSINRIEFENMADTTFDSFAQGLENTYNAKIEAEKEAERLRIEQEELIKAEQERVRLENIKLKEQAGKEAELRKIADAERKAVEEKAKQEQIIADAKLKAEREESERLRRTAQDKADAERKAVEEAERIKLEKEKQDKIVAEKLAKAPVKKQVKSWVESFEIPKSSIENEVTKSIAEKFEAFKNWALSQTENI